MVREEIRKGIERYLKVKYAKKIEDAEEFEIFNAVSLTIMEEIIDQWNDTKELYGDGKQAFYLSAEYLMGRALGNNLISTGLYDDVKAVLEELNIDINKIEEIPKFQYSDIINYIKDYGVDIDEYEEVEKYFLNEEDFYKRDDMSIPPLAISLSDFNKLRNMQGYEQINLANYEYTTQWDGNTEDSEIENYINQNKFLNVSGSDMKISKDGYYKETLGKGIYNYPAKNIIILPDEICKGLVGAGVDLFITTNNEMKYEDALEFEYEYIPTWFENNNKDLMKKYDSSYQFIAGRIKSAETSEILNASLGMRILGLYLGTVLLMISLTVLALQQLTDSIEHKQRFNILRKLGIEEGEINKIVLKQIGIYFAIPVTIGVIGFVVFIYNYYHIFETQMSSYVGDKMFILNMIIGIVLMIIVYVSYFLGTYYTFKRNIKN